MDQHEKKVALLKKYYSQIQTSDGFEIAENIASKKIDNAIKKFASGLDRKSIIGFYDITIVGSGKKGYLFTDTKVYYSDMFEKSEKIWYDDIDDVLLVDSGEKDCDKKLQFKMNDGTLITWDSIFLNKTPLYKFFKELLTMENKSVCYSGEKSVKHGKSKFFGSTAGGISSARYGVVNKLYDEEKFHGRQGHGFAAERANNLFDKITGHHAKIVGDDNVKNGADRVVDGVFIQSKYCQTGLACINECFDEKGNFRYLKNGKPMQIEVPSDKYDAAVEAMQEKIRKGKIPGVTDPDEAKNIVRKGHFTYEQAKNIAKAGSVESLTYDAVNGAIIATSAFGVTTIITLATNLWNGEYFENSLKIATFSGMKVGGTAFVTTIIASQLSKAGLNSALVGSSEAIVSFMGPKASAVLVNAFRSGSNIYGAAAMKSAAKLLRGNVITSSVTVVLLSSVDIANIFRGRISGKQLFKNLAGTATTVAGGTGGWLGGSAVGSMVFPGFGTIVGGLIGSVIGGAAAGKATDTVLGSFIEDDADEMIRIIQKEFEDLAQDYLLNQKEAEKSVDKLSNILDGKMLKDMYASSDRSEYARNLLIPIIENEVKKRKYVGKVTNKQMVRSLKEVLEDISDHMDENNLERSVLI